MATNNRFAGFPGKTLTFLQNIRANNNKKWFDGHRADYESCYVEPAKAFVAALETPLKELAPLEVEARINGSIRRINRDTRFSKDKTPYKDHLDFSFWEGERNNGLSSLFVRVSPEMFVVGTGFHGGSSQQIKAFRAALADPKNGVALEKVAKKLRGLGYHIGGAHYKRVPSGFAENGPAAEFLLHNGLYVVAEQKAAAARSPELVALCLKHWKALLPLHRWLVDRVAAD